MPVYEREIGTEDEEKSDTQRKDRTTHKVHLPQIRFDTHIYALG